MLSEIEKVTLGALFHDIGKFYQRAEGIYKKHTEFSEDFIRRVVSDDLKRIFSLSNEEVDQIAELCGKHHNKLKKDEIDEKIVQKADRLSSGMDRISFEKEEEEDIRNKGGIYKTLLPIFCEISKTKFINQIAELSGKIGYRFKPLNVENCYPQDVTQPNYPQDERKKDYSSLFSNFKEEIKKIPSSGDFNFKYEALKTLLTKYLWCVPSNTYAGKGKISLPDISLADHLTSTAAIATALKAYHEKEGYDNLGDSEAEKLILLSLDFSGIQKFIFQKSKETKKWGAKILRARSFVVSLALESVIRKFIREFKVNISVNVVNAGGKSILILPNYSDSRKRIEELRRNLTEKLLRNFFGEVKIKIAYVTLSESDLELQKFQKKLEELHRAETEERFKLFRKEDLENSVFSNYASDVSSSGGICPICGVRPVAKTKFRDEKICELCKYLIERGEKLPKSKGVKVSFSSSKWEPIPNIDVLSEITEEVLDNLKEDESVYSFGWDEFQGAPIKDIENYVPVIEEIKEDWKKNLVSKCYEGESINFKKSGIPKNFCHIALESLEENNGVVRGKPFLAVLKSDVDRLGYIFLRGFARDLDQNSILSISRYVSLSRMLDFFFTEILKNLIKTKYRNIYSVFSGGDDLFLIGDWKEILEFLIDFKKEFSRYVCSNPEFTVSTGIALLKPDTPVENIAELGEGALKKAKKTRNTTVVFDKRIQHDKGFELEELLKKIPDEIYEFLEEENLSTAIVYKLLEISEMANKIASDGRTNVRNLLWRSYLYYQIARNWKFNEELPKEMKEKKIQEKINYFDTLISKYSENSTENKDELKDNLFYIPIAIAIYRRRRYES
jgi:CRISPR-associated protein Csm1